MESDEYIPLVRHREVNEVEYKRICSLLRLWHLFHLEKEMVFVGVSIIWTLSVKWNFEEVPTRLF